ncbi:hypothetical protein K1719_000302 [Acacia pycnantha]|nr:hypothetical protein K1719_000302 [Acacia pycnantha]
MFLFEALPQWVRTVRGGGPTTGSLVGSLTEESYHLPFVRGSIAGGGEVRERSDGLNEGVVGVEASGWTSAIVPMLELMAEGAEKIDQIGDHIDTYPNPLQNNLAYSVVKSTLHRVLGNGQERYSIAYFLEPSHDCLVECLPTCKSESNPPKFPPILCQDYLCQRYKDTHADLSIYKKQ